MDEVHYLADRFRGAVWEEVIIHLPESVRLVALSATVSNAEEFGDWLAQVRGDTDLIVDEHRPVPLWQHMLVGHRLYDLFVTDDDGDGPQVNPDCCGSPATRSGSAGRHRRRSAGHGAARPRPARRDRARRASSGSTPTACCPPSRSSSAGPAATPRSSSACTPGSG